MSVNIDTDKDLERMTITVFNYGCNPNKKEIIDTSGPEFERMEIKCIGYGYIPGD